MVATEQHTRGARVQRYPPWLAKALAIKEASERFWTHQTKQLSQQSPDTSNLSHPSTVSQKQEFGSVWEAIADDAAAYVEEFVERDIQRVFARREGTAGGGIDGGGTTLLHEASTHGALAVVQYLLGVLMTRFPPETCRNVVNAIDTYYSQTTPLIAACRSSEGMVSQRLEIVRLLVHAQGDIGHQDSHGDNALHWCARESHVVLLRFFLNETDAVVAAISAENYKREKPLDIAKRQLSRKQCMLTTEAFNLLRHVDRNRNIQMKMQVIERYQNVLQSESVAQESEQLQSVLESANVVLDQAEQVWKNALLLGEKNRQMTEDAHVAVAVEAASREAMDWFDTIEGKDYLKKQLSAATAELNLEIQSGRLAKPKDTKRAATERIQAAYCKEKEATAKRAATDAFRVQNASYPRESTPAALKAVLRLPPTEL